MEYNSIFDDNEIPGMIIKACAFNLMDKKVYLLLTNDMCVLMHHFFDEISTGNILWEDAKEKLIIKIGKRDMPSLSDDKILEVWNSNPNMFMRGQLLTTINKLESSADIKNIIRDIKIGKITE